MTKWTSTVYGLPEEDIPVLVVEEYQDNPCAAFLRDGSWYVCDTIGYTMYDRQGDRCLLDMVTHWMPLPEPPKIIPMNRKDEPTPCTNRSKDVTYDNWLQNDNDYEHYHDLDPSLEDRMKLLRDLDKWAKDFERKEKRSNDDA